MYTGLVQLLHIIEPAISIGEYLSHSLYDEQIDIDLLHDYFRVIFHVEGKYLLPIKEGSYDSFYRYVSDHLIHPEDRERYMEHMEPEKLAERMTSPDSPGIFEVQFRCDNGYGGWRWVSQLVTSGERCGVPESIIRCFVYDIQSVRDREAGYSRVQEKNILEMDHLTGLYRNKDFYRKAESLLRDLKYDNATIARVPLLVKWHDAPIEESERMIKRRLNQLGEAALRDLIALQRADTLGLAPQYHDRLSLFDALEAILDDVLEKNACFSVKALALDGNDLHRLGLIGREIGQMQRRLVDAVIDENVENEKEALD